MTRNFFRGSMYISNFLDSLSSNLVISRIFGAFHDFFNSLNPLKGNSVSSRALRGKFVIFGFFDLLGMVWSRVFFFFFWVHWGLFCNFLGFLGDFCCKL